MAELDASPQPTAASNGGFVTLTGDDEILVNNGDCGHGATDNGHDVVSDQDDGFTSSTDELTLPADEMTSSLEKANAASSPGRRRWQWLARFRWRRKDRGELTRLLQPTYSINAINLPNT